MPRLRRKGVRLAAGLVISCLFLWLAARSVAWDRVLASLREARYGWLLPVFVAYFITVGARAWRWTLLFETDNRPATARLFPIVAIGYFANNVYPFRIGELVRAYLLRRRVGTAIGTGLATILAERVFDGLAVLSFVFVALPFVPVPGRTIRALLLVTSALFLGALLLFLLLASAPRPVLRLVDRLSAWFPERWQQPIQEGSRRFLLGLAPFRSRRAVLALFTVSILIWLAEAAKYWLVMHAFPFSIGVLPILFLCGVVSLATTLPSAPGYLGTFDAPGIAVLLLFGVPQGDAGAYTLVLHAVIWLSSVLFGGLIMVGAGVRWTELARAGLAEQ